MERGRVCRTKGGERGGIERLVPVDYTARPSRCFSSNVLKPQHACWHTAPPLSTTLVLLAWAKLSSTSGQGVVGSMPAQTGIQSVIRRLAVTNYWACLNSALADGHSLQRTQLNPRVCPRIQSQSVHAEETWYKLSSAAGDWTQELWQLATTACTG